MPVCVSGPKDVAQPLRLINQRYVHGREVADLVDLYGRLVASGSVDWLIMKAANCEWSVQ